MKKSKFLKPFSFASLALLMGAAGVFAFAPLGANPTPLATASETEYTTEHGLITPTADDPTLYTTESGLDIKFGLAIPTINASLPSGNLQGFPYFTTTSGSTTYTWVIIGRNSDVAMLSGGMVQYLYSQWKGNLSLSGSGAEYYFSNVDTTTPAGALIDTQASSKAYVYDKGIDSSITVNDTEIPSGCVLVLANDIVGSCVFHGGSADNYYSGMNRWYTLYDYTLRSTMEGYYTNSSFGLDSIKSQIVQQKSMITKGGVCNATYIDKVIPITNDNYIFPLSGYDDEVFYWGNYLTANQVKLSSQFWLRSGTAAHDAYVGYYKVHAIDTNGTQVIFANNQSKGTRPAFVLKLI